MALKDVFNFFQKNKKDSFLGGLGKGIVRPASEGLRWLGEGLRFASGAGVSALAGQPLWKYGEGYKPSLYDKDEWSKITGTTSGGKPIEALKTGIQRGAGIGSYIPMAISGGYSSLPQAVGIGALGGGLYSTSETENLSSPQAVGDILGGAALGGAAGAAGYGIQKLSQNILGKSAEKAVSKSEKLTNKAWQKRMNAIGVKYSDIADTPADAIKTFKSAWNAIDEAGLPSSTKEEFVNSIGELAAKTKPMIESNATNSTKTIGKNVFSDVIKKYQNRGVFDNLTKKTDIQNVIGAITEKGDNLTASDALELSDLLKNTLGGYKKLGTPASTTEKQFIEDLFTKLRTSISKKMPEISDDLTQLSDVLATKGGKALLKATEKMKVGIPAGLAGQVPGVGYKVNITDLASKSMLNSADKMLGRVGSQGLGVMGGIANATQNAGPQIGQALGIAAQQQGGVEQPMNQEPRNFMPSVSSIMRDEFSQQQQQQQPQNSKEQILFAALSSGASLNEAMALAEFLAPQEKIPAELSSKQGLANTVQSAIDMLGQYGGQIAGKVPTVTGKVGEFFGSASEGTTYRAMISDIRTQLINEIAGTAQTKQEMKNLTDKLPKDTDEPQVAMAKLNALLSSLSNTQPSISSDYTLQ